MLPSSSVWRLLGVTIGISLRRWRCIATSWLLLLLQVRWLLLLLLLLLGIHHLISRLIHPVRLLLLLLLWVVRLLHRRLHHALLLRHTRTALLLEIRILLWRISLILWREIWVLLVHGLPLDGLRYELVTIPWRVRTVLVRLLHVRWLLLLWWIRIHRWHLLLRCLSLSWSRHAPTHGRLLTMVREALVILLRVTAGAIVRAIIMSVSPPRFPSTMIVKTITRSLTIARPVTIERTSTVTVTIITIITVAARAVWTLMRIRVTSTTSVSFHDDPHEIGTEVSNLTSVNAGQFVKCKKCILF